VTVAPASSATRSLRRRVLGRSRDQAKQERAVLILHDVTKQYPNGKLALRDVDLVIPEGDFVFLVGPSGAGKSTLIKLLIRDEVATRGAVVLDGQDVARLGRRQVPKMRRKIGIIFQDFKLLPSKTVYENVAFALEVTGTPRRKIRPAVDRVLALRPKDPDGLFLKGLLLYQKEDWQGAVDVWTVYLDVGEFHPAAPMVRTLFQTAKNNIGR